MVCPLSSSHGEAAVMFFPTHSVFTGAELVFLTVNLLHLCNADSDTVGSELVSACRSHGVIIRFEI